MKESKILKTISYILIPILVAIMLISFLSNYVQNNESIYTNEKEYFSTDRFVERYFNTVSSFSNRLIYENENYPICYDGQIQISYLESNYVNYENGIEDFYILIQYKDKAITNVELTAETNTIEKIKNFISQNENAKKSNILAGNIQADSDVITNKGIKYFNQFEHTYYTVEQQEMIEDVEATVPTVQDIETNALSQEYVYETEELQKRQYITSNIQDFNIYSSYKEQLKKNSDELLIRQFLSDYKEYGENIYLILPIGLTLLLVIALYLILSIGHTKGKEGIDLNDLDKIPYEFVGLIFLLGIGIMALCCAFMQEVAAISNNFNLFISMLFTSYLIGYITCAVIFDTTIKRLKAKTLIKNTFVYKCCKWIWRIVKKTMDNFKVVWNELTKSTGLVKKLLFVILGYIIIAVILIGIFQGFGLLLDVALAIFIFYKIAQRINNFTKMEAHLKGMYEGNNTAKLNQAEFTQEFQNSVKYINDISNGFENAIQEGIKSERLKTELITNVSHDIKTPLTSIINYVDLLKKEEIENEKAKEYIEVLENKSQRLKKLTEDLLEASKASSGNVKLNLEKINVAELVKQSTGEFEDKFKAKNLEIICNISEEEICIHADNRYMYRIIENIFSNVSKYSMENSRVYIDVLPKDKKVYIAVKNISKEVLNISEEELMQRFVRGDKSRTTEGSGLGISISKSLAELQKGKFSIKVDGDLFKVELIFDRV